MRVALISMLTVLVAAAALCVVSANIIYSATDELDDLRIRAIEAARRDDREAALDNITALANCYKRRETTLEMFASHDALHETYSHITEARVCFEAEDNDDLYQALSQLGEALEHLRAHEKFGWSNIM